MPAAEVNGTTIHYETVASSGTDPSEAAPACIVLHGWPGTDHSYLRPGLDIVADRVPVVVYPDHRGHGRSGRPAPETITVEKLADDAAGLAAALQLEKAVVVGHFHGAAVAQELALRHPSAVAALILVAATPGELGMQESLADAFREPVATPPEVEILQRVPPGDDDEWAATMRALEKFFYVSGESTGLFDRTVFSAEGAVRLMQSMALWSSVDRLASLTVPVLLLAGRHDVFSPPFQAQRIVHQVPSATVKVFEESGHVPWAEQPAQFEAAILEWLDSVLPPSAGTT